MRKITNSIVRAFFFIFLFALFSVEIKDPDFWWHLKTGDYILEHGSIPTTDPFAYTSTPKDPLSPESVRIRFILSQYWLAQILFSKIFSAFGFQGIIYLRALILTLLAYIVFRSIRREGAGFHLSIGLTIPVVMILFTFTGERPQLFSFLFFTLIVFMIEGFKKAETRRDSSRFVETGKEETRGDSLSLVETEKKETRRDASLLSASKRIPFFMLLFPSTDPPVRGKGVLHSAGRTRVIRETGLAPSSLFPENGQRGRYPTIGWIDLRVVHDDNPSMSMFETNNPVIARPAESRPWQSRHFPFNMPASRSPRPHPAIGGTRLRDDNKVTLVTNPQSAISPLSLEYLSKRSMLYLIPIPLIMLFWANMHGGYIVGIALLLCYLTMEWVKYAWCAIRNRSLWMSVKPVDSGIESRNDAQRAPAGDLDDQRAERDVIPAESGIQCSFFASNTLSLRKLRVFSAVIVLSILVTLINPNTYKVIPFLVELEGGLYKSFIIETMSPLVLFRSGFYEMQFFLLFGLLAMVTLLIVISIRRSDPTDIVVVIGLAVASLSIARFIPYFAPISILLIARYGTPFLLKLPKVVEKIGKQIEIPLNTFFIVVLVLMLINGDLFKSGVRPNKYPEGAAQFLRENRVQGNMFNPYVWGGYLIWALYPEYKVFVDGRGLIPEVFFQEVRVLEASPLPVRNLPEWKAILDAYRVQFIVTFSVSNFTGRLVPLIPALLNESEWHLVYMDNISLIFVRASAENRELIERYGIPKEWLWNEVAVEAALKMKDAPNRANFYETMGDAFFMKGSLEEARDAYAKALALSPQSLRLRGRVEQLDTLIRLRNR